MNSASAPPPNCMFVYTAWCSTASIGTARVLRSSMESSTRSGENVPAGKTIRESAPERCPTRGSPGALLLSG